MNRHILIKLDKTIFQIIFYVTVLLSKLRSQRKDRLCPPLTHVRRTLVIRPGGLGDGIMSIPFLRTLREKLPDSHITLVCVKKNKAALQHLPYFDTFLAVDDLQNIRNNLSTLFLNQYDVVFDLEPFRKISSVIAYLSGADIRIGFDTNNRRLLYTHYVSYANDRCFESSNMIRQLKVLDIDVPYDDAVNMSFSLPHGVPEKTEEVFKKYGINTEKDFIVAVAPGVLKDHHRWKMSEFASLISMILKEDEKTKVLLVGSPSDIADAREVINCLTDSDRIINLVGETDFMTSLSIFQNCKILIACDGGIVYMAAAMGCSSISIWGPGVMERFKPPGDNHIGIRRDYFCVPCVNYSRLGEFPACRYDRRCMKDISALDVFDKYLHLRNVKKSTLTAQKENSVLKESYAE